MKIFICGTITLTHLCNIMQYFMAIKMAFVKWQLVIRIFFTFCSKHSLFVLVRTARWVPTIYIFQPKNKKIVYTPVNPLFQLIKWGFFMFFISRTYEHDTVIVNLSILFLILKSVELVNILCPYGSFYVASSSRKMRKSKQFSALLQCCFTW